MEDWDDEGFEPGEVEAKKGDAWDGEDEDDELKENWDDDEVEKPSEDKAKPTVAVVAKKKSSVKQKILEKEEQRKEEMLRKAKLREERGDEEEDDDEESIFASKLETKLRNQKLVEEADLEVTKDLFGATNSEAGNRSIDMFEPTNKEEFNKLAKMLVEKLSQFETSDEYLGFLEVLMRDLATGLESNDVKKLSSVLNAVATEKQNAQKAVGKKTKKMKKAVLGGGAKGTKGVDLQDYSTYVDEYDDFM